MFKIQSIGNGERTCFGVPQFDVAVVRGSEELGAVIVEARIADSFPVPAVRAYQSPFVVHRPELHFTIHGGGEEQVSRAREELDRGDGLGVPAPRVDELLGQVALLWRLFRLQINADVIRNMKEAAALIIERVVDVQL